MTSSSQAANDLADHMFTRSATRARCGALVKGAPPSGPGLCWKTPIQHPADHPFVGDSDLHIGGVHVCGYAESLDSSRTFCGRPASAHPIETWEQALAAQKQRSAAAYPSLTEPRTLGCSLHGGWRETDARGSGWIECSTEVCGFEHRPVPQPVHPASQDRWTRKTQIPGWTVAVDAAGCIVMHTPAGSFTLTNVEGLVTDIRTARQMRDLMENGGQP